MSHEPLPKESIQGLESQSNSRRDFVIVLLGLVSFTTTLRFWNLSTNSYWFDEAVAIHLTSLFSWEMFSGEVSMAEPLYYVILKLSLLFGESEFSVRLHSVIAGVSTVIVAYFFVLHITNDRIKAAIGGMLFSIAPILIFYSRDGKMYAWVSLCALCMIYSLSVLRREPKSGRGLALLVLASISMLYLHVVSPFYVAATFVGFVVTTRPSKDLTIRVSIGLAMIVIAYLPFVIAELRFLKLNEGHLFWALKPQPKSVGLYIENVIFGYGVARSTMTTAGIALCAAFIVVALIKKSSVRSISWMIAVSAIVEVTAIYFYSKSGTRSFFVDRYLMGATTNIVLLVTLSVCAFDIKRTGAFLFAVVLAIFGFGLLHVYSGDLPDGPMSHLGVMLPPPAKESAEIIKSQYKDGDIIVTIWHEDYHILKRYVNTMQIALSDIDGQLLQNMQFLAPLSYIEFVGIVPESMEVSVKNFDRVWLIIPWYLGDYRKLNLDSKALLERLGTEIHSTRFDESVLPLEVKLYQLHRADKDR